MHFWQVISGTLMLHEFFPWWPNFFMPDPRGWKVNCVSYFIGWWFIIIFITIKQNHFQDAFVKISRQEGIQSLWSGLPPTLVVAVPNTVIYFTSYEQLRAKFHQFAPEEAGGPPSWAGGLAGGLARVWSVTVVSPFELVRTKMQAKSMSYRGM